MIQVSDQNFNDRRRVTAALLVGASSASIWGMTPAERLRRALVRAGIDDVRAAGSAPPTEGDVVLLRADYVLDESLVHAVAAQPDTALAVPWGSGVRIVAARVDAARAASVELLLDDASADAEALDGLAVLSSEEIASGYNQALRKREPPLVVALTEVPTSEVEWRMFGGAYKGVTDFVTKYVWPRPAFHVTRWAARRGWTPNAVTSASLVLVLAALAWFAVGSFAAGLVAAWAMTFLDTVDGKLARVTLTSSKFGNVFDHGIDLIHPPFWYVAWWHGLRGAHGHASAVLDDAMWIIVVGYVVGRLIEGLFLGVFRFEIHSWRPIDSFFRLITARRNPNLVLLTAGVVAGAPSAGFLAVAAWTIFSLVFHAGRVLHALAGRAGGRAPVSWLDDRRVPRP